MLSKYTILHNQTYLEKKWEKIQKGEMDVNPPWGDGKWAQKSLPEMIIFNFYWLQYQKNKLCTLVLVIWDPKAYSKLVTS